MPTEIKWLSVKDALAYLAMGKTTFYARVAEKKIPLHKDGRKSVVAVAALDEYRNGLPLKQ